MLENPLGNGMRDLVPVRNFGEMPIEEAKDILQLLVSMHEDSVDPTGMVGEYDFSKVSEAFAVLGKALFQPEESFRWVDTSGISRTEYKGRELFARVRGHEDLIMQMDAAFVGSEGYEGTPTFPKFIDVMVLGCRNTNDTIEAVLSGESSGGIQWYRLSTVLMTLLVIQQHPDENNYSSGSLFEDRGDKRYTRGRKEIRARIRDLATTEEDKKMMWRMARWYAYLLLNYVPGKPLAGFYDFDEKKNLGWVRSLLNRSSASKKSLALPDSNIR